MSEAYTLMTAYKFGSTYDLSGKQSNHSEYSFDHLADRINSLNDRLTISNIENVIADSRQKLEKWRADSYNLIDRYYDEKLREFDRHVAEIIDRQRKEINRIRSNLATLTHKQDNLQKDIDHITTLTHQLEQDMDETKEKYLQLTLHPIDIKDDLIQIHHSNDIHNSTILQPPYKTFLYLDDSSKLLGSNDRCILIHHDSNICLLDKDLNIIKEKSWTFGWIMDICWSTTLARFFVLTRNYLFLIDESTMTYVRVQKIPKLSWWSCTCSDGYLYLTTKDWASNIYQFSLWPSIQLSKRWQPPRSCKPDETINDIICNKDKLALMIYNRLTKAKSIELRMTTTMDRIWSIDFDIDYDSRAIRCCLLNHDEWLVIDWNTSNISHISHDGKIKLTHDYHPSPSCAVMLANNLLAISTVDGINLHKI